MKNFILEEIALSKFKPSSFNVDAQNRATRMKEAEISITANFLIMEPTSEEDKAKVLTQLFKELSDKFK